MTTNLCFIKLVRADLPSALKVEEMKYLMRETKQTYFGNHPRAGCSDIQGRVWAGVFESSNKQNRDAFFKDNLKIYVNK